ncbi:MAG: IS200/IS605 family transposase [Nanoarchaeota archaeon]|nr:IS200/IS605 family transposase [Nanoarchaeota archaeon]
MEVMPACHCTYRIRYHMVFVLEYRKKLITDKIFEFMKEICSGIEERYYLKFDAMGYEEDYMHILVRGAPRYSPSRIMQICKSILAIQIFKKFPKLKEDELWGGEFWSDGGHVDTVGDRRALDEVRKYVLSQGRDVNQLNLFEFS